MVRHFEDGLTGANEQINQFSERALRPYLRLRIFGPYTGDCENYLKAVARGLRDLGYKQALICSDHEGQPPEDATREEQRKYWLEKSFDFLRGADVAVFLFLENRLDRSDTLPDSAFNDDRYIDALDSGEDQPDPLEIQDLNSSCIVELKEWVDEMGVNPELSMVIYEESCFNNIGPLIASQVENIDGLYEAQIPDQKVEKTIERIDSRAQNWVTDHCKLRLQDRYINDQD